MTCVLADPADPSKALSATFFGQKSLIPAGMVEVDGQGMQKTEYKGSGQITCGAKAFIRSVGGSGLPEAKEWQGQPQRKAAPAQAATGPGPIHGASVGMAINQANTILLSVRGGDLEYFFSDNYPKDLWRIASPIVKTAQVMEGGRLHGEKKAEAPPPPPPPQPAQEYDSNPPGRPGGAPESQRTRPEPGPDGSVYVDDNGEEDDVPF
jgi:hypothetical protein